MKYTNYGVVFSEIPDETTLTINISNCPIKCDGCHSKYLWEDIGEPLDYGSLDKLLEEYGKNVTCVCFMGGDREPEKINALALHIKTERPELKVGWYSGRDYLSPWVSLANLDYVKIGSYKKDLGGLKSKTTNQILYKVEKDKSITDITYKIQQNGKFRRKEG